MPYLELEKTEVGEEENLMQVDMHNVIIRVNSADEVFVKKNSRNIASTIAGRLGSWKFPFVSVKPDMMIERPGDFEIELEKGGNSDG